LTLVILWLHVVGVVVWLGALMYQTHVLLPLARRGDAAIFAEAARRQRPIAWTALSLVVLSGFYNVTRLGPLERVMETGAGLVPPRFPLPPSPTPLPPRPDFPPPPRLRLAITTNTDPAPALRSIGLLDRISILIALVIIYLGLTVSRS